MRHWSELSGTARDTVGALATFLGGTALYLAHLSTMTNRGEGIPLTVRLAILAAVCVATFFRRRKPLWAMLGGLIPLALDTHLGPTVSVWVIYADLIYAAVLYAGPRASRIVAVVWFVFAGAMVLLTLVLTQDMRSVAAAVIAVFSFVGTPIWWANSVRTHKDVADAERARLQAMTMIAELDRRAAIADERKTMARDLHDVIAGHLSAIAIQSEAALGVLARTDVDPKMAGILGSIRANSVGALQEMRTMIGLLRSDDGGEDIAAPRGLDQLPILVDAARSAGIAVRIHRDPVTVAPPRAVDQAAYRIIQEALTNAMKHAPGSPVDIDIRTEDSTLTLTVRNPLGAVRDRPGDSPRHGLVNMRERATALSGTFTAGADSGVWRVSATLPLSITADTDENARETA
ncbi:MULTISPECIES: histidine kinase [unclassified Nocardia]|uniref:sensor histidine kinase n=1 Tax=unclassified Nocardia TaxID=2637762 RepID=UPI001CE4B371|nr:MULTISPECIES: histidine kinase [unclassified Nocardia]